MKCPSHGAWNADKKDSSEKKIPWPVYIKTFDEAVRRRSRRAQSRTREIYTPNFHLCECGCTRERETFSTLPIAFFSRSGSHLLSRVWYIVRTAVRRKEDARPQSLPTSAALCRGKEKWLSPPYASNPLKPRVHPLTAPKSNTIVILGATFFHFCSPFSVRFFGAWNFGGKDLTDIIDFDMDSVWKVHWLFDKRIILFRF